MYRQIGIILVVLAGLMGQLNPWITPCHLEISCTTDVGMNQIAQNNTLNRAVASPMNASPKNVCTTNGFAINLTNTSAKVTGNSIDVTGYVSGIVNSGVSSTLSNSLLCSNTVNGGGPYSPSGIGINATYWNGVAELNDVSGCDVGHLSTNDIYDARILFSRYHDNTLSGLELANPNTIIDLRGFHYGSGSSATDINTFNSIDHNNSGPSSSNGQITMADQATLMLGGTHNFANEGKNSIVRNSNATNDYFVFCASPNTARTNIHSLTENFWGTGTTSISQTTIGNTSPDGLLQGVTYDNNPAQPSTAPYVDPNTESCGDGLNQNNDGIISKNQQPLSIATEDTASECSRLFNEGSDRLNTNIPDSLKSGYVIFKQFIETCATQYDVDPIGKPWHAFGAITTCVSGMDTSNIRWLEYREWLKKVLYYSSDSLYYCADVTAMFATFHYLEPGQRWMDINGMIAIIDYLIDNNRCPEQTSSLQTERSYYRQLGYSSWQDTATDPLKTPYDSSAKNIDSLGFSILRGPQFGAVASRGEASGEYLDDLVATKNPFAD